MALHRKASSDGEHDVARPYALRRQTDGRSPEALRTSRATLPPLTPQNVLAFQRLAGNRAARQLLAANRYPVPPMQAVAPPTAQRRIRIDTVPAVDIRTPTEVRDLLERNGIHYYYKYTKAVEMIDKIDQAALSQIFRNEAHAVQWILKKLRKYEAQWEARELEKRDPGAQEFVQRKLVEICELLRRQRQEAVGLDLTTAATATGTAFTDPTTHWYEVVVDNGLCGGWASLHRRRPKWFEAIWEAIEAWNPTEGRSTPEEVQDLQKHLRSTLGEEFTEDPLDDVVSVLTSAYEFMDRMEPKAGYGSAPDVFPIGELSPEPARIKEETVPVTYTNAGRTIFSAIASGVKQKQGDYLAHIETGEHHMSARVSVSKRGNLKGKWHIVESEKAGVVVSRDKNEIYTVFSNGVFLGGPTRTTEEVKITVYRSARR